MHLHLHAHALQMLSEVEIHVHVHVHVHALSLPKISAAARGSSFIVFMAIGNRNRDQANKVVFR